MKMLIRFYQSYFLTRRPANTVFKMPKILTKPKGLTAVHNIIDDGKFSCYILETLVTGKSCKYTNLITLFIENNKVKRFKIRSQEY